MKKCPKCGQDYPNTKSFCPSCGEKLVSVVPCPKCGAEITPSDKFCPGCGAQIIRELKCPKCGKAVKPGAKFCDECGEKLPATTPVAPKVTEAPKVEERPVAPKVEERPVAPAPKAAPEATEKRDISLYRRHRIVFNIIFGSILYALTALAIVSVLGPFYNGQPFTFFFGDLIKTFSSMSGTTPTYKAYFIGNGIAASILYYLTLVGLVIYTIFVIVRTIQYFVGAKKTFSAKFFYILPFILMAQMGEFISVFLGQVTFDTIGWGAIMGLIVSLTSVLAGGMLAIFQVKKVSGKNITRNIFYMIGGIASALFMFFGFQSQIKGGAGVAANAGLFAYFAQSLSGAPQPPFFLALIGNVLSVGAIILVAFTIFKICRKKYVGSIVLVSIAIALFVGAAVFGTIAYNEGLANGAQFGIGAWLGIVFGALVLACSITCKALAVKQPAKSA